MKARRLLALSILVIGFGCEGHQTPTSPGSLRRVPFDSTAVLSDGAHGGNPDFFFLPPLVPLPLNNPNFEIGKFNNTLAPSLRVEICQLLPEYNASNVQVIPLPHTQCVAGGPVKTFAPGTVQLVNLPLRQAGWWNALNLPPDGFYYVLWDTRASSLNVNSYYRIKIFVDGNASAIGFADVDPMANIFQWKSALTGDVIQLVNGLLLPIPFRIEKGALCGGANNCTSTTVTNNAPGGFQTVTIDGGGGSIAGATFPNGWLPAGGPQSVVVTISSVNTGPSNVANGTETNPCHPGLNFEQFNSCFKYTTTPTLPTVDGSQFALPVTVAVCYVLQNSGDPREHFAEMYASGPNEPPHALTDVSDAGILAVGTRNCSVVPVIGSTSRNPLIQLASNSWRKLKGGVNQLFGVKTAYAVDVGLGGLTKRFSNIGPVLPAQIVPFMTGPGTTVTLQSGTGTASAKIVANHVHGGEGAFTGVDSVPVTFSVAAGNGSLLAPGSESAVSQATVKTRTFTDNSGEIPFFVNGISSVIWTPPTLPGDYTMTATGPATGGPITYHATVPRPWNGIGFVEASSPVNFGGPPFCDYTVQLTNIVASLLLNTTGGGAGTVSANNIESLAAPPCGDIQPAPPHFDHYSSTSVTRTGNSVSATFAPVGNPIAASLVFAGTFTADQQTLIGTFTWHRTDQAPPLDWTIVVGPVSLAIVP